MFGVRRAAGAFAAATFGLLLTIALATPAQPHISKAWHGQDFAVVTHTHNHITWCDQEADGHRTIAYYVTRNGQEHWTDWDGAIPHAVRRTPKVKSSGSRYAKKARAAAGRCSHSDG